MEAKSLIHDKRIMFLLLLVLGVLVYGRSVTYPFLEWDDATYITDINNNIDDYLPFRELIECSPVGDADDDASRIPAISCRAKESLSEASADSA